MILKTTKGAIFAPFCRQIVLKYPFILCLYTMSNPKTPAYQRIKDSILANIHSGEWTAGSAIPTEMELTQAFGVSRMTVNRALKELTDERVLERRQGSGTFVAQAKFSHTFVEIRNIAKDIIDSGRAYKAEVLDKKSLSFNELPQEVQKTFFANPLNKNHPIFMVKIVHYADNQPLQLEERWVLGSLVPEFVQQDFTKINTSDYLIAKVPLERGDYTIGAVSAPPAISQILKIPTNAPALLLSRKTISQGLVVTVVKMWHAGERYQFSGEL